MPNIMSAGIDWLNTQLAEFASVDIVYRRGQIELSITAVRGNTDMEVNGDEGLVVVRMDDFIIDGDSLASLADTGGTDPREADLIIVGDAVYRVANWRNSDSFGERIRIHTSQIGTDG